MGVGNTLEYRGEHRVGHRYARLRDAYRNGRNGMLFTRQGVINIRNKKWADDFSPLDEHNPCAASQNYIKAYLRHLFVAGEILGMTLASISQPLFLP